MRVLIISPLIPWPLYSGGSVRIFNLLKQMSEHGHQIFLLAGQNSAPIDSGRELPDFCQKIYNYKIPVFNAFFFIIRSVFSPKIYPAIKFNSEHFKNVLDNILSENKIDVVWVNFSMMADMLPADLNKTIPVILDQHESERSLYYGYLEKGSLKQKIFALINIIKLKRFEEKVFSKINALVCVSEEEAAMARKHTKKEIKILVVPNGVDENFSNNLDMSAGKKNTIVFCANMAIRRNIEAATWFAARIFPKVKKEISDAEFQIVGSWPSQEVLKLNSISGVCVIGMVKDIEKYYARGKVFVSPYHFGAGTKLKVLEAMASGIPIVSTSIGCRGIDVTDKKHILIADSESDFSRRVVDLLQNDDLSMRLSKNALELIKQKYYWKKIVDGLEPKMLDIVKNR